MENMIQYFYNMKITKLKNIDERYWFKSGNHYFYLVPIEFSDDYIYEIYELNKKIISYGYHQIILNRDNQIVSIINGNRYVLLRINNYSFEKIKLNDLKFIIVLDNYPLLYRNNWLKMWEERIDYIEYQLLHLDEFGDDFKQSIYYFLGMSENAISYLANILSNGLNISYYVSHRRVGCHVKEIDYYNPLEVVLDYKVRDVSEYLKCLFMDNDYDFSKIEGYLNRIVLSDDEVRLLYARLLFPTFYFDLYEKIINKEEEIDKLYLFVNRTSEYEVFLQRIYTCLSKKTILEEVDWLKKRES